MKKIIIAVVCICMALLPSQILGDDLLIELLNEMAKSGQTINNIFQPSKNGYVGGFFSTTTYKGTLLPSTNVEVAMKFTHDGHKKNALKEYEIYTCLEAIDNKTVEAYGIPSVSYYGSWKNYTLMAITLLDSEIYNKCRDHELTEMDILIICREFVRISKYIHRHGILHNDLHLGNIMFRNNRAFIIDYNGASKFYIDDADVSSTIKSEWKSGSSEALDVKIIGVEGTKDEWESFAGVIDDNTYHKNIRSRTVSRAISELRASALNNLEKKPKYNEVYDSINDEINRINRNKAAFVSWLKTEQKPMAMDEPMATIESIDEPSDQVTFHYPETNYNYFAQAGTSSRGIKDFDLNETIENDLDSKLYL